jgi:hypothetical protein
VKKRIYIKALCTSIAVVVFNMVLCDAAAEPVDGAAQWIWQAEEGPKNTWVAFRKEFDLKEVPQTVVAQLSTDTKYWLWINGEMVLSGAWSASGWNLL